MHRGNARNSSHRRLCEMGAAKAARASRGRVGGCTIAAAMLFALEGCALPQHPAVASGECGNGGCLIMIPLGGPKESPDAAMPRSSGTTLATNPLPAVRMGKEIGVPMPAH